MKLKRVIRLDSTPLNRAFFTEEGYLIDTPILTSTGIFEYSNSDGSVRRELRLPEEVFSEDSLASYMAKPVIVTHDAGLVNKDNVHENEIGTILTNGYRDGEHVRAKIVIHDTDEMKKSGLKELSLGYNLDLDETPGEWEGQHYDAIQRNIRINHLALVREARAGDQARLNIDSRDAKKKGVTDMRYSRKKARRSDGVLSPEELAKAIEEYKARHPQKPTTDEDEPVLPEEEKKVPAVTEDEDDVKLNPQENPEDIVDAMKEKQAKKDSEEEETDLEEANKTIAHQDEDIQTLLDIIDSLLAERDFKGGNTDSENENEIPEEELLPKEEKTDEDDDVIPNTTEEEAENEDEDDDAIPNKEETDLKPGEVLNADSVDRIIRDRVKIGIVAEKLNLDSMENLPLMRAKRAIIKAVRPTMNLDGKGAAYINAAFDCACEDVKKRSSKGTNYQKRQMFNKDSKEPAMGTSAEAARRRMIERRMNKNAKEDK